MTSSEVDKKAKDFMLIQAKPVTTNENKIVRDSGRLKGILPNVMILSFNSALLTASYFTLCQSKVTTPS